MNHAHLGKYIHTDKGEFVCSNHRGLNHAHLGKYIHTDKGEIWIKMFLVRLFFIPPTLKKSRRRIGLGLTVHSLGNISLTINHSCFGLDISYIGRPKV